MLPDAPRGSFRRVLRAAALAGYFVAGAVGTTAALPWVEIAVRDGVDAVRSVAEVGFLHGDSAPAAATPARYEAGGALDRTTPDGPEPAR